MSVSTLHSIFKSTYIPEYVSEYYFYGYTDQSYTDQSLANFLSRTVMTKESTKAVDYKKLKLCEWYSDLREALYRIGYICLVSLPSGADVSKGMIQAVTTDKDRANVRKSTVKLGRFLLKMYPWLQPTEIESIVDIYKEKFGPRKFTIHRSDKIAKICRKSLSATKNFSTTAFKKSLANSCMRHSFPQNVHPMKAYENGEFEVIYLLDEEEKLAARTILRISNGTYAPIYCVCEQSYNELKDYMRSQGYRSLEDEPRGWAGATLQLLDTLVEEYEDQPETDVYAVPYVDCIPCAYNTVEDGSIVIRDWEDFDGEDYDETEPRKGNYVYLKTAEGYWCN